MKQPFAIAGLLAAGTISLGAYAGPETPDNAANPLVWNVDVAHTEINFSVRHFFTPVSGSFDDYEVNLMYDAENPANSTVEVVIDVASVNTGNERRDNHLRSGDWFEAERYPQITFKSKSVQQAGAGRLLARGDLAIKGVTREVELEITVLGLKDIPSQMQEMLGGVTQIASFTAATGLDRGDYGVGVGSWAETMVVGSDVEISISVEANRK
jgi:polyisoprenoid-binding protein YceI